jgi:hypothetical protein
MSRYVTVSRRDFLKAGAAAGGGERGRCRSGAEDAGYRGAFEAIKVAEIRGEVSGAPGGLFLPGVTVHRNRRRETHPRPVRGCVR